MAGVPAEKIKEGGKYWDKNWMTFSMLEQEALAKVEQVGEEKRQPSSSTGDIKRKLRSARAMLTTVMSAIDFFSKLSNHPNQILAKEYIENDGLVNIVPLRSLCSILKRLGQARSTGVTIPTQFHGSVFA